MNQKLAIDTSQITGQLSDWWRNIPDDVRSGVVRGAIGAGGGALLGKLLMRGNSDRELLPGGLSPALLGALLGGGSAVAAPIGMRMLTGDIKFKPKNSGSLVDSASNAVVGGALGNPGLVAGTAGGAALASRLAPSQKRMWAAQNNITSKPRADELLKLLQSPGVKNYTPLGGAKTIGGKLKHFGRYIAGTNVPQGVVKARQLAGVAKNPRAAVAAALATPLLGMLFDRHAFGRNG